MWDTKITLQHMQSLMTAFWDWLDNRAIIRRIAFFLVMWMLFKTLEWTLDFATNSPRSGGEVAAIIASVWAPLTALQAAVFALYSSFRGKHREQVNTYNAASYASAKDNSIHG